jgi:hypothetical protein
MKVFKNNRKLVNSIILLFALIFAADLFDDLLLANPVVKLNKNSNCCVNDEYLLDEISEKAFKISFLNIPIFTVSAVSLFSFFSTPSNISGIKPETAADSLFSSSNTGLRPPPVSFVI